MAAQFAHCDLRFLPLLAEFDSDVLERSRDTIYGVWPDLTLAYLNPAWYVFAFENCSEPDIARDWILGRSILDSLPAPIHGFFQKNYRRCLVEGRPWHHVYECSSDEVFRKFHLTVLPLGKSEGLLLINSLVVESPLARVSLVLDEERYRHPTGVVVQCCHCRKFRRADDSRTWDWVPPWIKRTPKNLSHAICEICVAFYYPDSKSGEPLPTSFTNPEDGIE
ncbi:MAG: hypothetical protein K8U03_20465 [Planctomycetia bacterium]|nr:hypothetical protein [Planctomycetia bacterium]